MRPDFVRMVPGGGGLAWDIGVQADGEPTLVWPPLSVILGLMSTRFLLVVAPSSVFSLYDLLSKVSVI